VVATKFAIRDTGIILSATSPCHALWWDVQCQVDLELSGFQGIIMTKVRYTVVQCNDFSSGFFWGGNWCEVATAAISLCNG